MNNYGKHFLLYILLITFITACDSNKKTGEENPVFQQPQLKAITEKINTNPDNAGNYYQRGVILVRLGADSLALTDFKKAVSLDSNKAEYYSAIGNLLFENKDLEGSVRWIEKALAINPDDMKSHLKLAQMFLYLKEYPTAFKEINTVLRQDVYNSEAYFLKGMVYKDMKDTAKAISSFQTSVQVDPQNYDAIVQLGLMFSAKKDPLALQYFDNAWRKDTMDAFPLFARGVFYQNIGDYNKAKLEYRNVITRDRQYAAAYINTGYILIQQDSFEKAWKQYDLLVKMDPANYEAYYNRGFCSELMKKNDEAIADYKQALTFHDKYPMAIEGLKRLGVKQ
jgi:tetratricopeptide (TPR) repeat protein